MKVHLISSKEVSQEKFENVVRILQKSKGPLKFIADYAAITVDQKDMNEEEFDYKHFRNKTPVVFDAVAENATHMYNLSIEFPKSIRKISWNYIFRQCQYYRQSKSLSKEDYIILLTDLSNNNNWFSAIDPTGRNNCFVHTAQWEYFISADARFPIAYQVMEVILEKLMFDDYGGINANTHKEPRGCINDFCEYKKQITFKLRTADICPDCQKIIQNRNIDRRVMRQIFSVLDDIRTQMLFRERFETTQQPSRLSIKGEKQRIFLTDLNNAELKLNPLEKILYLLFLEHPGGIRLNELCDHKRWLKNKYASLGGDVRNRIDNLVNVAEDNASIHISKIKSKIESLLGYSLAQEYIIEGGRGDRKKIKLERKLVEYETI